MLGASSAAVLVPGTLAVTGVTTTNGITNTGGIETDTLNTKGVATLNDAKVGTLAVTGATTLTDAKVGGTLAVTGATTLTGALSADGGITTSQFSSNSSDISTDSATFISNGGGMALIGASAGGTHLNALVMSSTGPAELWGDLVISQSPDAAFTNGGNLQVQKNASVGGTLAVTGATTLTGALAANGGITTTTLVASGNTSVGGALAVTGATTLTGALAANGGITTTTLNTSGDASIGGNLDMTNGQIRNLANGTAPGDAVNFDQLETTRKDLSAGIASAAAMANIPLVEAGKSFAVGLGVGGHDGQSAYALGGSYRMNSTTVIRGSVAGGNRGKSTVGAGLSFSF